MDEPAEPTSGSERALHRVIGELGGQAVLDKLADTMSGADLTTLLLEVFRRRAARVRPADVMRRYRTDRFAAPGQVPFGDLRRAEDSMLATLPDGFDVLTLAPVAPMGTHWATADVDPRKVIATIRGSEVVADPTNALALEAAVRRRRLLDGTARSSVPVRLAATQRVTRAQLFSGPVSFAHFQLLGVVTAGRDTGDCEFEREHLTEHLRYAVRAVAAFGVDQVRIAVTCLDDQSERVLAAVRVAIADQACAEVVAAPERESGRAYYRGLCYKVFVGFGGSSLEVGDGGFVDWTARLLGNRKERMLIGGYGIERLATLGRGALWAP